MKYEDRDLWDRIDIDKSALRDALAYRMALTDPDERLAIDRDIAKIRARLEAEGIDTNDGSRVPGQPVFTRGERHHGDPPGTVRISVTNPSVPAVVDDEPYPRGPRNGVVVAAAMAVAMLVVGG